MGSTITDYFLDYSYQSCFDDGGIGHDCFWNRSKATHLWECKSQRQAREKAYEILSSYSPCRGSFCDNKDLKRFHRLYERKISVVVEKGKTITTIEEKNISLNKKILVGILN